MMAAAGRPAGDAPRRPVCTEDEGEGVMRRMWRGLVGDLTDAQSAAVLLAAAGSAGAVWWRTRADGPAAALAMGVVAFDLVGGLVAFPLPGTREHYAATGPAARVGFAVVHVQPFVLPLTRQGSLRSAAWRYGGAVTATVLLEVLDPGRRRILANAVAAALSAVDLATSAGSPQRWLGPVYLVKVIGGHGGIAKRGATLGRSWAWPT